MADNGNSGNGGMMLIGLVALVLLGIAAYFLMNMSQQETARTNAVAGAAKSVDNAAKKVGDAVDPGK